MGFEEKILYFALFNTAVLAVILISYGAKSQIWTQDIEVYSTTFMN